MEHVTEKSAKKTGFINSLINYKNVNRGNWSYILTWVIYYAWVIVFTTWWTASPQTDAVFGTQARTMLHSINLISSAIFVFLLKKKYFKKAAMIGAVCVVVSAILFLTLKNTAAHPVLVIVLGITLGVVNAGILIPFVFRLNNTEKFYAVVSTNLLISVLILLQEKKILNITNGMIPSLVMLILGLIPIFFFRTTDVTTEPVQEQTRSIPRLKKRIYIGSIVLNIMFAILCRGVGKLVVSTVSVGVNIPLLPVFYIGAIGGCALYFMIYALFKNANIITWNVTFGTFVVGMLLYFLLPENTFFLYFFAALIGVGATMGTINMYYVLGVIGKKYNSLKYVRMSVLFIGVGGGLTGVLVGFLLEINPLGVSLAVALVALILIVILLCISPTLARTYFNEEWAKDSERAEIDNENSQLFERYHLSKRETELCKLLLDGMTLRQSSAIMGVSFSTVNTYQTSVYRKLNINSKTELMLIFKDYVLNSDKE